VAELSQEIPNAGIFVGGAPDSLGENGIAVLLGIPSAGAYSKRYRVAKYKFD
jgi:hypothetical protein